LIWPMLMSVPKYVKTFAIASRNMAATPVELVRPQPATSKRSMLRVTAAMFCAAIVVAYVVMVSAFLLPCPP
jgi:hypothetical protein